MKMPSTERRVTLNRKVEMVDGIKSGEERQDGWARSRGGIWSFFASSPKTVGGAGRDLFLPLFGASFITSGCGSEDPLEAGAKTSVADGAVSAAGDASAGGHGPKAISKKVSLVCLIYLVFCSARAS